MSTQATTAREEGRVVDEGSPREEADEVHEPCLQVQMGFDGRVYALSTVRTSLRDMAKSREVDGTMSDLKEVKQLFEPNEELVSRLEHKLEQAREGKIRAFAMVFEYHDGSKGHQVVLGKLSSSTLLVGEIEVMKTNLILNNCLEWKPA